MTTAIRHNSISLLNRRDPTHTTGLRTAFARDMKKRFSELNRQIRRVVVKEDGFGLFAAAEAEAFKAKLGLGRTVISVHNRFDFPRSQQQVEAFMEWFHQMVNAGVLEVSVQRQIGQAVEEAWTDTYVRQAYEQGAKRGRMELIGAGYAATPLEEVGLVGAGTIFLNPMHADRVGLLYSRTFAELKGITAAMDSQISRVLAQGIADGESPTQLARLLTRTITGPSGDLGITDTLGRYIPAQRRATILARTEIIRAHHVATIQEYRNWAAEDVYVKAELVTAEDGKVCKICHRLTNRIFTLDEIERLIPLHPQ